MVNELFRLPDPYVGRHRVAAEEIDAYGHVNNAHYVRWLDRVAWDHSTALGITPERCLTSRRGMAVRHSRLDYLAALIESDEVLIATWIYSSDGRLRCSRRFEIARERDGVRAFEAEIDYFSLNLDTGRPSRFPPEFTKAYAPLPSVLAAYEALPEAARHVGSW